MFKRDQPAAPDLPIAIGNPHHPIDRMTLRIDTHDVLDAVTESDITLHRDFEIGNSYFGVPLKCEKKSTQSLR